MFERILCIARSSGAPAIGNIQLADRLIDAVVGWSENSLSQPEPQGVTDEKLILKTYCDARRSYCYDGPEHENWQRDAERGATMAGLRAVLTRYATPPSSHDAPA